MQLAYTLEGKTLSDRPHSIHDEIPNEITNTQVRKRPFFLPEMAHNFCQKERLEHQGLRRPDVLPTVDASKS